MTVALQIKDVRDEVRELLEREYRAERNKRLFEQLTPHRALYLGVDDVAEYIRQGREDSR